MNTSSSTDSRADREGEASVTPAPWDPYEVWLTRVKLPRELVRREPPPQAAATPAARPETDDGASSEPSFATP